jgi:hypothetical protein
MAIAVTVSFFALMVLGVPIFMAFILTGGFITGFHLGIPWSSLAQQVLDSVSKYMRSPSPLHPRGQPHVSGRPFTAPVDMFIGYVRHLRGGLPMALVAIALFSAISG